MKFQHHSLVVQTKGRGMLDISRDVQQMVGRSGIDKGLLSVFIHHTSASLFINENADPDVQGDLERYMARLVVDGDEIFRHTDEGPDDMAAHIRSVLTATSLTIPIANGRCDLGTWQGVYVWEHRQLPHRRRLTLSAIGSP